MDEYERFTDMWIGVHSSFSNGTIFLHARLYHETGFWDRVGVSSIGIVEEVG